MSLVGQVINSRLSAQAKFRDKQLAKQQTLLLDAVGPVNHILEEAAKGQLTQKTAIEATQAALKLLGNASAQASRARRANAIQNINTRLADMEEDENLYKDAPAPALFGDGFAQKAKERDEQLKCLNQASYKTVNSKNVTFFRGAAPAGIHLWGWTEQQGKKRRSPEKSPIQEQQVEQKRPRTEKELTPEA